MTLLMTLAALALPSPAQAATETVHRIDRGGCHSHRCLVRVARKQCERGIVRGCVRRGARRYSVDEGFMLRIAYCESTMNPNATNGDAAGLFQFMSGTWRTTPYTRQSRFSAKWSSLAAGWMFAHGRADEWACS